MTDEQIIKALDNISYGGYSCIKCKYSISKGDDRCGLKGCNIAKNALDLIKRQQAEIEFYKEQANKYEAQVQVLLEQSRKQRAEIGKLKIVAEPLLDEIKKEISGEAFRKNRHHSLCETETFEGR